MFDYRTDGTILIMKSGTASLRGRLIKVIMGDIVDIGKDTINSISIDEHQMRLSLQHWMDSPTDETDPYWKLFKVKDQVNDALVAAVKYGYEKGYKAAKENL